MTIVVGKELSMNETLLNLVLTGKESANAYPSYVEQWDIDNQGKTLADYLGVSEEDIEDLNNHHSFAFIAYRIYHRKHLLDKIYPGTYVQFVVEYDDQIPHKEYAWVDSFNKEDKTVDVQCDDSFYGNRSLTINLRDIIQVLPTKERPNIFFKAMLCKDCKNCSKESGEFIEDCAFYSLFTKIKQNRLNSRDLIGEIVKNEKPKR